MEKKSRNKAALKAALFFHSRLFSYTLVLCIMMGWGGVIYLTTHPSLPSLQKPLIFYSNQTQDNLKLVYLRSLEKATSSIFLIIYGLTDPDIIAYLQYKASEGVDVTLFYDPTASTHLDYETSPFFHIYPIKSSALMHKKILVIDDALVYLGSANMTEQSLKMHDNSVIGLYHRGFAHHIKHSLEAHYRFTLQDQALQAWILPEIGGSALKTTLDQIRSAKNTISVAMFTFTHPELAKALIEAHERGVNVSVAVDHYSGKGASKKILELLQASGIKTYLSHGGKLLHHKWCLIDEKILMIGSTNWTKAAFSQNDDCLLLIEPLSLEQKAWIGKIWNSLEISQL